MSEIEIIDATGSNSKLIYLIENTKLFRRLKRINKTH